MVSRAVQNFCILEGTTDPLIEQWLKFLDQFTPDIWRANTEDFKSISWAVSDLLPLNWSVITNLSVEIEFNIAFKSGFFKYVTIFSNGSNST